MKVFVVDDEQYARQTIIAIINDRFPNYKVVGEAESVSSAVKLIPKVNPDLVFLDIDLSDGTGFDIINFIKPVNFRVIFVTAHHEYAIKAIKFSALDYILKPVSSVELVEAIKRLEIEYDVKETSTKFEAFENNIKPNDSDKKIVLKTSKSIHLVNIDKIIRCEADNNYTTIYLNGGQKIVISKGLKDYDDLLSNYGFLRVHQSHLINLKYMERFDKRDGGFVVCSDNSRLPVSQRKKQLLLDFIDDNNVQK